MEKRPIFKSARGNSTIVPTLVSRHYSDKCRNWVLGTVGNGIIICEGMCSDEEIENGSIFQHLARHVLGTTLRSPDCLTWYLYSNGDYSQTERQNYYDYLTTNPEAVFLTIYEISDPHHFICLDANEDAIEIKDSKFDSQDTIERLSLYVKNKKFAGRKLQVENGEVMGMQFINEKLLYHPEKKKIYIDSILPNLYLHENTHSMTMTRDTWIGVMYEEKYLFFDFDTEECIPYDESADLAIIHVDWLQVNTKKLSVIKEKKYGKEKIRCKWKRICFL